MRHPVAALLLALPLGAAAAPPALTLQPFVSGLVLPVEIGNAHDLSGRLFVLEQPGRIRVIRNGQLLATPFLDISSLQYCCTESGLLGLAFHPQYAANGRFYVYYTAPRPGDPTGTRIVIARYNRSAADPDVADPASGSIVLTFDHPTYANHHGGKIAFGPDGYLYASVGDGGLGSDPFLNGQNLSVLLGKILRIDVDNGTPYAIPPTNPFVGSADPTVRKEIWAYGFRNPWRFTFDRATGDLFIGDVGEGTWEEINFEPAGSPGGRNYGWSVFEGTTCFRPPSCSLPGMTLPVIEYAHDAAGGHAVIGGFRYRGAGLPALAGYYVYGDNVVGHLWAASPDAGGVWTTTLVGSAPNVSAFGEDEAGELYATNLLAGQILRVTPPAPNPPRLYNISSRGDVLTGEDVLIGGFVVGGSSSKNVAVVATGPSLAAYGITNPLMNPTLTLVRQSDHAIIATNDDWQSAPNAAQLQGIGFQPPDARESAILINLPPGAYTAIVQGVGGTTGVGLVAAYEVDHPETPLANISTRANVLNGNNVLIAGLIIQGSSPQTVVITATGPSLVPFGIANPLADPTLALVRQSDSTVIAANDDWQDAPNAADIQASGFAPTDPKESAIMMTLDPGAYTAIVSGSGGGTGVGVVGVFRAP